MSDKPWKKWERLCAEAISGSRYPFNSGGRVDVESERVAGQCKELKECPLAEQTRLLIEIDAIGKSRSKVGVLFIRYRAGRGNASPGQVVMTIDAFAQLLRGGVS